MLNLTTLEVRAVDTGGRVIIKYALWAVLGILGLYLFFRFLLPCLAPFILAFLTAALCEPVVRILTERLHLRRGVASAICVLVVLSSLLGFFMLVVVRLIDEGVGLIMELPRLASGLPDILSKLESSLRRAMENAPQGAQNYMNDALLAIGDRAAQLPAALSQKALGWLSRTAAAAPATLLFLATFAIGSFFISCGFEGIMRFLRRQIPQNALVTAGNVKRDLLDGLGRWLRAELTLMAITFAILTAAFSLMKVEYAVVIALLTAIIDALPVFGSGVVLLPWALVSLLSGSPGRALTLTITWLVATLSRSCLEPKLIGDQFGVSPAAALLAMYAGFKLTGVVGMVLFPFILMMLNQMNTKGYIKLWK